MVKRNKAYYDIQELKRKQERLKKRVDSLANRQYHSWQKPNGPNNRQRHEFLLTFFEDKREEAIQEINGFVLRKYLSGNTNQWEVAIFTPETYKQFLYLQRKKEKKLKETGTKTKKLKL